MQPRRLLAAFTTRVHCFLMEVHRIPRSSTDMLSKWSAPSRYKCVDLFPPRWRTFHLPLLKYTQFLSSQSLNLSRFLWKAAQPSDAHPSFVLFCKLAEDVHRSLMKIKNSTESSINPLGRPLLSCLQLYFVPLITNTWTCLFSQFSIQLTVYLCNPYFLTLPMMIFKGDSAKWLEASSKVLPNSR